MLKILCEQNRTCRGACGFDNRCAYAGKDGFIDFYASTLKEADVLVFDVPAYHRIPYHFGVNHLSTVVKNGDIVMEKRYANA